MNQFYYLDVSLIFDDPNRIPTVTEELLEKNIIQSIKQVFGESISNSIVDVLCYKPAEQRVIIRVPFDIYVKVRSSLTLASSFENIPCRYHTNQAKPILLGLLGDSRNFKF